MNKTHNATKASRVGGCAGGSPLVGGPGGGSALPHQNIYGTLVRKAIEIHEDGARLYVFIHSKSASTSAHHPRGGGGRGAPRRLS
jgi:hypothetical protein